MIRKIRKNRKAVSPVIATLLMIAIAVAAAILVYVWSMGLIGTLQTGGGEQVKEQLMMEAYDWTATGTLKIHLRNVGTTEVVVAAVYVEGVSNTMSKVVSIGAVTDASATSLPTIVSGRSYNVKIVTSTGGVFSYSCIAGKAA